MSVENKTEQLVNSRFEVMEEEYVYPFNISIIWDKEDNIQYLFVRDTNAGGIVRLEEY